MITSGFKSFADKITIDFTKGITGIVGPNGSGKSNVVDAVRWVLGEQSVKSLRGDGNMTDVIFSGSKSRNALNVASVTLVFDNSDHYLPIDYEEVSIQRRVYKDGTNEYSLNNEKCRLKDIVDILLDSGMAKESFNIISQGKIEEIISSKPSERRIIFEEAAQVLKYRRRKEEALRKLERTHENMNRVDDILHELEEQVEPLKKQHDEAIIYQEKMSQLEKIEVALIVKDITDINFGYQRNKEKIAQLNEAIMKITTDNSTNEAKIESYKSEIQKLDSQIATYQSELLEKTTQVEKINSEKTILLERKKYEVEDQKLHNNLLQLKEQQLKLESDIHTLETEILTYKNEMESQQNVVKNAERNYQNCKSKREQVEKKLTRLLREKSMQEYTIRNLQDSIDRGSTLPYAVRSILENPKLRGIHNVIGNLIEVEEQYATAITTSLGYASTYLVVEDEQSAKDAISYLKQNNVGRATFFPISVIAPKSVDSNTLQILKQQEGFIGVASDLVSYQAVYEGIMKNQLGNVVVARNIDDASIISKKIQYRYKIVTLDGELLHVGGSLTGGNTKNNKSILTEKYELEHALQQQKLLVNQIEDLENEINALDSECRSLEDKLYVENKELLSRQEICAQKNNLVQEIQSKLQVVTQEISGTTHLLDGSLSQEEETVLASYYQAVEEMRKIEIHLQEVQNQKESFSTDLKDFEFSLRQENSSFYNKNKELKELEIEVNRMDVKLDHLLTKLNETYSMTYEKAVTMYVLEMDIEKAREQVNNLKRAIRELGTVNLGAIEEYERVSERYTFLNHQREDLVKAEDTLLEIIQEMDAVMEAEFSKTFQVINENFSKTFQELFKGGSATLKLTDPDHLLETGIEIVASPPGKKLTSISLLSGGEKTFTAISLLFAILKSRPVPFCILDEVEAALDEVNVDSFGEYLMNLKDKTQFILITHKKRTMEYADVLYGITMQESGVSKLVSVKLEEIQK